MLADTKDSNLGIKQWWDVDTIKSNQDIGVDNSEEVLAPASMIHNDRIEFAQNLFVSHLTRFVLTGRTPVTLHLLIQIGAFLGLTKDEVQAEVRRRRYRWYGKRGRAC
jgi:hypothetical protein